MIRLILVIIVAIFIFPPVIISGIPFRIEDVFFIGILLYFSRDILYVLKGRDEVIFVNVLMLFLFASIISFVFSVVDGYSPIFSDVNSLMMLVRNIVIFIAGLVVGRRLKSSINDLFIVLFVGCFIMSIVSITQYFNIFGLGDRIFLLYGTETGLLYGVTRAIGTVGNPNYASFFQLVGLILILAINYPKRRFYRILYIVCSFVVALSIIVTFSRTGLLAGIIVILIYLYKSKSFKLIIGFACLGTILLVYYFPVLAASRLSEIFFQSGEFDFTFNGRLDLIWIQRVNQFLDNPFWGVGSQKASESSTVFSVTVYDNSFLGLLVINGFVGFFIYCLFYLLLLFYFRTSRSRSSQVVYVYVHLLFVLIFLYFLTTDLYRSVYFVSYFYFSTAILVAYLKKERKHNAISFNLNSNPQLEPCGRNSARDQKRN